MQTVGLTWEHSFELAALLAAAGGALALVRDRRARFVGAFLRETAVIGLLYGLWRLAGTLSVTDADGALARGRWIARAQHDLGLPSEHALQAVVLGHPLVVQAANLYYATMHFTTMLVFLIWLFVRHRDRYRPVRQVMAWTTLGCLLVQFVPVAPPRMFPQLQIVDTGMLYHQSVYANGFAADQMSAMPSVHVAWA
ncbi:MAG: phosphatase PAP2 family protein, partial [Jatrophihabitans sp.]